MEKRGQEIRSCWQNDCWTDSFDGLQITRTAWSSCIFRGQTLFITYFVKPINSLKLPQEKPLKWNKLSVIEVKQNKDLRLKSMSVAASSGHGRNCNRWCDHCPFRSVVNMDRVHFSLQNTRHFFLFLPFLVKRQRRDTDICQKFQNTYRNSVSCVLAAGLLHF